MLKTDDTKGEYVTAEEELAALKAENLVLYAAILEASALGKNAALRCKVELQRIAKKDAANSLR